MGVSPEAYASKLVSSSVAQVGLSALDHKGSMSMEEFLREFPVRGRALPQLSTEDLRRENFYDDRW